MSSQSNPSQDDDKKVPKSETIAKYAPAASAFITAIFVVLTGININHQVSQQKIENAFLIRAKLTPKLSVNGGEEYTPEPNSENIVGIRVTIRNELPATTHYKSVGAQIYTCDGELLAFKIITRKGTSSEAVVTPALKPNGKENFSGQIQPLTEAVITTNLWSVAGYSREQLALVEEKQNIVALMYIDFWVEGVNNFREFIFEHVNLLMDDAPSSIDEFSDKPFSLRMDFPLVFEVGDGFPRAIPSSSCRNGINVARSQN